VIRALSGALLLSVCSTPRVAHAQQAPTNQISYDAVMHAPVGSWSDYVMSKEGEAQTVHVRYTLVERSSKRLVLEIDLLTPMGRMLSSLEFAPDGGRWKLVKARRKMGAEPAKDTPLPEGSDGKGTSFGKGDSFGDELGRGPLTVKAGKFDATHYRREANGWATEIWVGDKVQPTGMVQVTDGQGSRIELAATGKGGKSAF
jgi:hypothetical protein